MLADVHVQETSNSVMKTFTAHFDEFWHWCTPYS